MAEDMTAVHAMSDITTGTTTVITELLRLLNCMMTDLAGRSWAFEKENDPAAGYQSLGAYVRKGGSLRSDTVDKTDEKLFEELLKQQHIPYICNTVGETGTGQDDGGREQCIFTTREADAPLMSDIRSRYLKELSQRLKQEELQKARSKKEQEQRKAVPIPEEGLQTEEPDESLSFDRR